MWGAAGVVPRVAGGARAAGCCLSLGPRWSRRRRSGRPAWRSLGGCGLGHRRCDRSRPCRRPPNRWRDRGGRSSLGSGSGSANPKPGRSARRRSRSAGRASETPESVCRGTSGGLHQLRDAMCPCSVPVLPPSTHVGARLAPGREVTAYARSASAQYRNSPQRARLGPAHSPSS